MHVECKVLRDRTRVSVLYVCGCVHRERPDREGHEAYLDSVRLLHMLCRQKGASQLQIWVR